MDKLNLNFEDNQPTTILKMIQRLNRLYEHVENTDNTTIDAPVRCVQCDKMVKRGVFFCGGDKKCATIAKQTELG